MSRRFRFERTTWIPTLLPAVFEFFSAPQNLSRITPPAMGFRIISAPERRLRQGDRIEYRIRIFGIPLRWVTRIVEWNEGESFADLQERGPYRYWLHTHSFSSEEGMVEMQDVVEYELPLGALGRMFGARLVQRQLEQIFDYRAAVIQEIFVRADSVASDG